MKFDFTLSSIKTIFFESNNHIKIKSMSPDVRKLYNSAINNEQFLYDISIANGDQKPYLFASSDEKHFFATAYYEYLVGKYGKKWKNYI